MTVTGELNYLAPESTVLRRFTAPGSSVNTGTYRGYRVPVRDGRPVKIKFTLDQNGYSLLSHVSAVRDFMDDAELDRVYAVETAELVRSCTGASRVAPMRWMRRRSADPAARAAVPRHSIEYRIIAYFE